MTDRNIKTPAYVVHAANEPFKLEEIVLDAPQDDELLVEMKYSGICHTDLVFQTGEIKICKYPAVFGHEGAGFIRSIGPAVKDTSLKVGDFVLLSINYCQKCKFCINNHPADCVEGTRLHLFGTRDDGTTAATLSGGTQESVRSHFFGQSSFSRFSFVHETCVVKHPCDPEDAAMFAAMGCGYQTGKLSRSTGQVVGVLLISGSGAGTVMNILKPEPDSSIVIFGLGTVGLTALMGAKYLGVRQIIGVDLQEKKFAVARDLGATHVVNSRGIDIVAKLKELTSGKGFDYAVDCTGAPPVIEAMLNSLSMRGSAAQVGVPPPGAKIQVEPLQYLLGSRRYMGCREGDSVPTEFIPKLVEMQRSGQFPVEKLTTVYDYKDMDKALHDLHEGDAIKPVLKFF